MAIFEVQDQSGKTYEIDAPDEGAALKAFQSFKPQQQPAPPAMQQPAQAPQGEQALPWYSPFTNAPQNALDIGKSLVGGVAGEVKKMAQDPRRINPLVSVYQDIRDIVSPIAANPQGAMDAAKQVLDQKFGTPTRAWNTFATHPVDAALLAAPGFGLMSKGAEMGGLARTAAALSKAEEFTNPVNAIAKPLGRYTPLGTAPIEGQTRNSTNILKTLVSKDAASRAAAIGPEAMLLDTSPSMTGLARGVAAKVGPGTDNMVEQLIAREKGKSPRMLQGAQEIFGKGRDPEALKELIMKSAKRAAKPFYESYKSGAPDLGTDAIQNIVARQMTDPAAGLSIDGRAKNLELINKVEDALNAQTNEDKVSQLRDLRTRIDKQIEYSPTMPSADKADMGVLQNARNTIDEILKDRVAGQAEGDAIYSKAHKAREAVDYGYNSLEGGKSAIFPETFTKQLSKQPKEFVMEGQKSRIANAMGTQSNDLVALRKLMGGDGDFNRMKLESTFGPRKIDDALKLIDGEGQMTQNFADIVRNSKTAQSQEAAKLIGDRPGIQFTGSETMTGLPLRAGAKAVNYLIEKSAGKVSATTSEALANALTKKGDDMKSLLNELSLNRKVPLKDKVLIRAILGGRIGEASKATQEQSR